MQRKNISPKEKENEKRVEGTSYNDILSMLLSIDNGPIFPAYNFAEGQPLVRTAPVIATVGKRPYQSDQSLYLDTHDRPTPRKKK